MPSTLFPDGRSNALQVRGGAHTSTAATGTVVTGLDVVVAALVSLKTDPADACSSASVTWSGGTLTIKTWMTTNATADCTPKAEESPWGTVVSWLAFGY